MKNSHKYPRNFSTIFLLTAFDLSNSFTSKFNDAYFWHSLVFRYRYTGHSFYPLLNIHIIFDVEDERKVNLEGSKGIRQWTRN